MAKSGGKKGSLKTALSNQQTRLKKKQEAAQAARLSEQKGKKIPQAKDPKAAALQSPPTVPFAPSDKILLVGEGNFSFAHALIVDPPESLRYLPPENIIATAYDQIKRKNATKSRGIADQDRNILSNQVLLLGFLRSASQFLTHGPVPKVHSSKGKDRQDDAEDDGENDEEGRDGSPVQEVASRGRILVTLRNVAPYTLWDLPRLAKKPPPPQSSKDAANPTYMQLRSFKFHRSMWKGYEHRMTKGERAHGSGTTGQGGEDRTWEFCMAPKPH
ncbi:hypothetical protein EIP91_006612 [Steccherinum ochraceum]|uniref:25S rRNA (uridine-N(3))-methyltransferase BMT5-like domain-containing protein n=1 Tax=Steccherinum ochraceum TaxID=92696 RepID=A0A4R0RG14_9APHY|nr:hypothetical protein EIP91_006612 [Steccherinum ochraceum]